MRFSRSTLWISTPKSTSDVWDGAARGLTSRVLTAIALIECFNVVLIWWLMNVQYSVENGTLQHYLYIQTRRLLPHRRFRSSAASLSHLTLWTSLSMIAVARNGDFSRLFVCMLNMLKIRDIGTSRW